MATRVVTDAPALGRRIKKSAEPRTKRIAPDRVVDRLLADFPDDMARLAE